MVLEKSVRHVTWRLAPTTTAKSLTPPPPQQGLLWPFFSSLHKPINVWQGQKGHQMPNCTLPLFALNSLGILCYLPLLRACAILRNQNHWYEGEGLSKLRELGEGQSQLTNGFSVPTTGKDSETDDLNTHEQERSRQAASYSPCSTPYPSRRATAACILAQKATG